MTPSRRIPTPTPSADSPASARLNDSRERLAAWLATDRAQRARPSLLGWAASAAWPLVKGLREHPSVSLAAGALVQRLLRPAATTERLPAPAVSSPPAALQGLALARRHPRAVLALVAVAAAVWLWRRPLCAPAHRRTQRPLPP